MQFSIEKKIEKSSTLIEKKNQKFEERTPSSSGKLLVERIWCYLVTDFQCTWLDMSRRGWRKINSKTVKGLMSLSHVSFRNKLTDMASRRGKKVINPSETYTSKCCSTCGYQDDKLAGASIFRCRQKNWQKQWRSRNIPQSFSWW